MRRTLALLSLLALAACGQGGDVGTSQQAITEGADDAADPSVVFVFSSAGEICTGSVIAPRLVLTAAHCMDAKNSYVVGTAESYDLSDPNKALAAVIDVDAYTTHPGYDDSVTPHLHDVAVLKVASDVGTPVAYHAGAPKAGWVGQPLRLVGYGRTSPTAADYGTRRTVDTVLASYNDSQLVITNGKQGCPGDSGGPAFMTIDGVETLVGTSSASTADCKTTGYYERLDGNIEFVNAQVAGVSGSGVATQSTPTGSAQVGGCSAAGHASPAGMLGLLTVAAALFISNRRRRAS